MIRPSSPVILLSIVILSGAKDLARRTLRIVSTVPIASEDKVCHPERSEGSGSPYAESLHIAQGDSQNTSQVRSQEV